MQITLFETHDEKIGNKIENKDWNEDEDVMTAIIINATIMIHHNARGFNSWARTIYTCAWTAKGPGGIDAETKRPQDLIGANWPTNPAVPLIKSRAVVSPFVSSLNVRH